MKKKLLNLFKPNNFKDYFYGWLSNQAGHVLFGLILVSLTSSIYLFIKWVFNVDLDIKKPAYFIALFWLIWEIRHLTQTKDWKDFFQDLFFEWSGVVLFLFPPYSVIISLVFVYSILKEFRDNGDKYE